MFINIGGRYVAEPFIQMTKAVFQLKDSRVIGLYAYLLGKARFKGGADIPGFAGSIVGELKVGEIWVSHRELAHFLALSRVTIRKLLTLLEEHGFIKSIRKTAMGNVFDTACHPGHPRPGTGSQIVQPLVPNDPSRVPDSPRVVKPLLHTNKGYIGNKGYSKNGSFPYRSDSEKSEQPVTSRAMSYEDSQIYNQALDAIEVPKELNGDLKRLIGQITGRVSTD